MFNQHNQSKYLRSSVNGLIILIIILGTYFIAWAQKEPDIGSPPYKINGKEVKEYLIEKYQLHKIHKDDLTSTLQQTSDGPKGKLHINSFERPFTPQNIVITDTSVQGRARAIAQAFLKEEAALLGITNMGEIRERRIDTTKGRDGDYTTVRYNRYIDNLELNSMYIWIDVGPGEKIIWVSAELVPASPELYEAVKKKTLGEDEIRRIVGDDLKAAAVSPETEPIAMIIMKDKGFDPKTMQLKKIAVSLPPYVVWKVESVWVYTIDAFSGEILKKDEGWIE